MQKDDMKMTIDKRVLITIIVIMVVSLVVNVSLLIRSLSPEQSFPGKKEWGQFLETADYWSDSTHMLSSIEAELTKGELAVEKHGPEAVAFYNKRASEIRHTAYKNYASEVLDYALSSAHEGNYQKAEEYVSSYRASCRKGGIEPDEAMLTKISDILSENEQNES